MTVFRASTSSWTASFAGNDYIAAFAVQFDQLHRNILSDELFHIPNRPHIHLGARHEGADPHVHGEAAFHPSQHSSGDDELFFEGFFEVVPDFEARGFFVGQQNVAFGSVAVIDHHLHDVSRLDSYVSGRVDKLLERGYAVRLVPDVDKYIGTGDLEDFAFDDFVARRGREVAIVFKKVLVFFRVHATGRRIHRSGHVCFWQGFILP